MNALAKALGGNSKLYWTLVGLFAAMGTGIMTAHRGYLIAVLFIGTALLTLACLSCAFPRMRMRRAHYAHPVYRAASIVIFAALAALAIWSAFIGSPPLSFAHLAAMTLMVLTTMQILDAWFMQNRGSAG
jgi:hypothetical protein